jgi:hypothetical protein
MFINNQKQACSLSLAIAIAAGKKCFRTKSGCSLEWASCLRYSRPVFSV